MPCLRKGGRGRYRETVGRSECSGVFERSLLVGSGQVSRSLLLKRPSREIPGLRERRRGGVVVQRTEEWEEEGRP